MAQLPVPRTPQLSTIIANQVPSPCQPGSTGCSSRYVPVSPGFDAFQTLFPSRHTVSRTVSGHGKGPCPLGMHSCFQTARSSFASAGNIRQSDNFRGPTDRTIRAHSFRPSAPYLTLRQKPPQPPQKTQLHVRTRDIRFTECHFRLSN